MFQVPAGCLLVAVVMSAYRSCLAQTSLAAFLEWGAVLVVALGFGPPARWEGAAGVQDPGQVLELEPGIVPGGLVPVIAWPGQRLHRECQV